MCFTSISAKQFEVAVQLWFTGPLKSSQ
uniref:Uncharacterized protein n=1 Tax=Arundo donax TaxID=35708 RepID=A0A0A9APG5_ARUDO